MLRALKRLLTFFGFWSRRQPPGAERDPYAWRPVPIKPRPKARSGAVAVAEPDEPPRRRSVWINNGIADQKAL